MTDCEHYRRIKFRVLQREAMFALMSTSRTNPSIRALIHARYNRLMAAIADGFLRLEGRLP